MKKTVIGSGIYNLDIIVVRDYPDWPQPRPFTDRTVLEEVGGTCGNVMCILSWLGWKAMPQVCLDDSPEGLRAASDLKRYGCDCRYVTNTPEGGTSTLKCTHMKSPDGRKTISFRAGSPGGSRFPKRHFLRARDEAPAFLEKLDECPAVYFFDDPAAGHRLIAGSLREKGAIVYFEPSRVETKAELEAVGVSDIIKFSGDNVPDVSFTERFAGKLFIQTLGSEGLRFKLRGNSWVHVPPVPCEEVVDWEGAGDWTTTAIIWGIGRTGKKVAELNDDDLLHILTEAQHFASESISFMGPKGGIRS